MELQIFLQLAGLYLAGVCAVAVATEALIEIIKRHTSLVFTYHQVEVLALAISLGLAFSPLLKVSAPLVGVILLRILGGAIASRGSNLVHDLLDLVKVMSLKSKNLN